MDSNNGFVVIQRKLLEWEWYHKSEMVHLFLHLILNANHEEKEWQGIKIKRGQLIVGRHKLSEDTGISERTIRTCINRLKSTNEITIESTNRFSLITVIEYDKYQTKEKNRPTERPANRPTTDQLPTTNNNYNNDNNIYIQSFLTFWELYDKKVGRPKCEKKWSKLSLEDQTKILDYIPRYKEATPDKKYRKNPETFLNNRSWEDELPAIKTAPRILPTFTPPVEIKPDLEGLKKLREIKSKINFSV